MLHCDRNRSFKLSIFCGLNESQHVVLFRLIRASSLFDEDFMARGEIQLCLCLFVIASSRYTLGDEIKGDEINKTTSSVDPSVMLLMVFLTLTLSNATIASACHC